MSDQEDPPVSDIETPIESFPEPSQEDSVESLPQDGEVAEQAEHEESKAKDPSSPFQEMLGYIESQTSPDAKIAMAIGFMEKALAQSGLPQFRTFWELRRLCQKLFREDLAPGVRAMLWSRFNELSEEGRRLKEILDEQSAFAVEQIDIAVKGLEADLKDFPEIIKKSPIAPLPVYSQALEAHVATYQLIQHELTLLNACASRINALRKELMKTDMRIGQKNRFFQRLSAAGDCVFPRRKELIKNISDRFISDVDAFIAIAFGDHPPEVLRGVREEIKALQAMAKTLTLNTQSLNNTRKRLSECWDKLKEAEKDQRSERAKTKAQFREKAQEITAQIDQFKEAFQRGEISIDVAKKQIEELSSGARALEILRDELNTLREGLKEARQAVLDRVKANEKAQYEKQQEKENQRRARVVALQERITLLLAEDTELSSEQMTQERDAVVSEMDAGGFNRDEKAGLDRELKQVRDAIIERREKELLNLSEDDQQALQQLRQVLAERVSRRQEIRQQLETLRREGGQAGRDFEQALLFSSQQAEVRARLERVDEGILEIEEKIGEIQEKI